MARQATKAAKPVLKTTRQAPVNLSYLILLLCYGFVTVLTPNLETLDSNGPKFLTLALLNLITFIFLFTRKEFKKRPEWYFTFFRNGIGISYAGLMLVALLSFFKAINVVESVLHFAKIFTTFSAAYLVSVLIIKDKRNIFYLCVAMTLLLIFDSLTVFSGIIKYINGKLGSIVEIQTVYSNKNILASSLFVKIPFALWLIVFHQKWMRTLGMVGTFLALSATLFMSTRAFYLGIFALSLFIFIYLAFKFFKSKDKYQLQLAGIIFILLASSILIFSITQRYLYPKTGDLYDASVGARLATISSEESSGAARLNTWKWSWHLIKKNPILGVGLGNWKIAVLEETNQTSADFIYPYKAHNDFIETTTETGIFGGLLFIAMFLLTGWTMIRTMVKSPTSEWLKFLFLPAFGLLCYSFDAMFNFPQDRPEIQALFALYVGAAIAVNFFSKEESAKPVVNNPKGISGAISFQTLLLVVFGLGLTASSFLLVQNFNSLKLQRLIKDDFSLGKMTHPASLFLNEFPSIPNLNVEGEPISVQKARYLLDEKRNNEVINLLKKDKSSPYDARPEYAIALAYNNMNNLDSSLAYSKKVLRIKPFFFKNISLLCELLEKKGLQKEIEPIIDNYLSKTKDNQEAWIIASSFYDKSGNTLKAVSIIDSAARYLPADSLVLKQKRLLDRKLTIQPFQALFNSASDAFNAKKYNDASRYFSEILSKEPGFIEARAYRAYCYYFMNEYKNSINDLDLMITSGKPAPTLYNLYDLLGSNYYNLGNKEEACKNYKIAAGMGDKNGSSNYSKLCQPGKE